MVTAARPKLPLLPFEPLLALYGGTIYDLAAVAGQSRAAVTRVRSRGGLLAPQADRWATAIGLHPSSVWGDAWWDLAEVAA